jgi:hypothetical protein
MLDHDLRELAENTGRREAPLTLGGVELTLRPMTLNDIVESKQDLEQIGAGAASAAALRSQLYHCARRGGYTGTEVELADLVTELDVYRVREAMAELFPTDLQSTWGNLVVAFATIRSSAKLKTVLGPVADAIEACVDAVRAAESGAPGEAQSPGDGAGSSGA